MPDETIKSQEPTPEALAHFVKALAEVVRQPKEPTQLYANSTSFEVSGWDLKIFFGQLDLRPPKSDTDWHTAMTIPWMQARIMEYYLRANIVFYEKKYGPIALPPQLRPPAPPEPTKEQLKADPLAVELWQAYKKIYDEMFGGESTDAIDKNLDRLGIGGQS
jgi:hypothetical protein